MRQLPHTVNDATSDKYQLDELLASGALTPEEHDEALALTTAPSSESADNNGIATDNVDADIAAAALANDGAIAAALAGQQVQQARKGISNPNRVRLPYHFGRKTLLRMHANAPQRLVDAGLTHDEWATFYDRLFPIHDINETGGIRCLKRLVDCGFFLMCCIPCAYTYCVVSRKNKAMNEWADDFNAQVLHKYQIYLKLQSTDRHVEKRIEGELPQDYTKRVTALIFALGESEIEILKSMPKGKF